MAWQRLAGNHRAVAGLDESKSSFVLTVSRSRRGWEWEGRYIDLFGQLAIADGFEPGACAQAQVAAEEWARRRMEARAEINRRVALCNSLGQSDGRPA